MLMNYQNKIADNVVECDSMKGWKDAQLIVDKTDFIRILDSELVNRNCKRRCEAKECTTKELFRNLFDE